MNYKLLTFLLLGIFVIELVLISTQNNLPKQTERGKYVTMYTDLPQFEGVRVYYQSYVKEQGVSESHLIKVCENEICRKPYSEEIKQDRYLPQDFP